jgi:asparagine synthase (glutamine-hydrolysing)
MCGIFGTVNYRNSIADERVFEGLRHRGPDQYGYQAKDNVQLYHTRLSIQDLSLNGCQPMQYKDFIIVFNGEIYNHMELRKKYGLYAESNSDTLTILLLFELLGIEMLEEFDGMFAFSLYAIKTRKMYLARDRAGKKPLYVFHAENTYIFSSELNVLYQVARPEINYAALADYLYLGHFHRKATPYLGVNELENGCYLEIDTLTLQSKMVCWFQMGKYYQDENNLNQQDTILKLDTLLQTSVKRRITSSDLTVGSFLSGGIDSGLVTAIAAQQVNKLKTFTVKVEGEFDESALAAQVAKKYDTEHQEIEIGFSDLSSHIEKILNNHGEPNSDNSAIPSYYVAREAKKHISVVLNGDGADELFGGYRRYVPFRQFDFFNAGSLSRSSSRLISKLLPVANHKQSSYTYFYRLLKFAGFDDLTQMYCSASSDVMVGFENMFLQNPLMKNISADIERINGYEISPLKKMLLIDFESMLFGRLLPKMDIATMAHSLEGRSPFLGKDLLEFAPGLSDRHKIKGATTKVILRQLAEKYLPVDLVNQPKRGFEIPLKKWVDHELRPVILHYLLSSHTIYEKIIRKDFIKDLIDRKIKVSDEKRAKILFCVFSLEVWYKNLPQ